MLIIQSLLKVNFHIFNTRDLTFFLIHPFQGLSISHFFLFFFTNQPLLGSFHFIFFFFLFSFPFYITNTLPYSFDANECNNMSFYYIIHTSFAKIHNIFSISTHLYNDHPISTNNYTIIYNTLHNKIHTKMSITIITTN